jgi:hypothetical protein
MLEKSNFLPKKSLPAMHYEKRVELHEADRKAFLLQGFLFKKGTVGEDFSRMTSDHP